MSFVPIPSAEAVLSEWSGENAFATTLAKGLVLLEAFEAGDDALGNIQLATRTGIPRPTVARLTHTLAQLGYLRHDPTTGRYRPGARGLRALHPLLAGMPFRQVARPLMHDFAQSVRGTVSIGLLDGTAMVYVETARSSDVGPHMPDIGMPIPVLNTAMGRAAAATLAEPQIVLLEGQIATEDPTGWPKVRTRFRAGIKSSRERGFCVCLGEYIQTIHAVAAPLFEHAGRGHHFAINCGIPAYRLRPGEIEAEIGPRIAALAASIRTIAGETPGNDQR